MILKVEGGKTMNRKTKKIMVILIIVIIFIIAMTSINSCIKALDDMNKIKEFANVRMDFEIRFIGKVSVETALNFLRGLQISTFIMACIAVILTND